ncbi:carbohydrate-binding module family 21 protein [Atractiella rhizophila]|nr:carbohydrate-binding module family 21 protein [Atractiella rhizophila]
MNRQSSEEDYECSTDDEEDEKWLISRHLVNFPPFPSSKALNSEMYLETIDLCSPTAFDDGPPTCLRGRVAVQNLAFRKSVLVRWTVDGWKSHSEVLATSLRTTRGRAFEEFEFEIGLDEMSRNTTLKGCGKWWEKRLQFCIQYRWVQHKRVGLSNYRGEQIPPSNRKCPSSSRTLRRNSFELTPGLTSACLKGGEKGFVDCSTCELKGCEGFQW